MTTDNISLFQAMNAKMRYLSQREKIISQNVANADTANYNAQDLAKVDFSKMLANVSGHKMNVSNVSMATTNSNHLMPDGTPQNPKVIDNKKPYEVNPSGNGVDLEEQMLKSNDVQLNYSLMVNLYKGQMDMIRTSLGKH
ncbi:MAG: flagellar basal body rod protein FlgB [Pseudomonadota bacterium]